MRVHWGILIFIPCRHVGDNYEHSWADPISLPTERATGNGGPSLTICGNYTGERVPRASHHAKGIDLSTKVWPCLPPTMLAKPTCCGTATPAVVWCSSTIFSEKIMANHVVPRSAPWFRYNYICQYFALASRSGVGCRVRFHVSVMLAIRRWNRRLTVCARPNTLSPTITLAADQNYNRSWLSHSSACGPWIHSPPHPSPLCTDGEW